MIDHGPIIDIVRRAALRRVLGGAVALSEAAARCAHAAEVGRTFAVVYPELGEPFRQIFAAIIEGMEDRLGGLVITVPVGNAAVAAQVVAEIRKREVQVLVGLGRGGMRVAAAMAGELPVMVGCVVSVQESEARSFPVHTLAPDPALLLARLRRLKPSTRRVHMVFDATLNAWLARLARDAARVEGLELLAQEVVDQAGALRAYAQILAQADPVRDALWLPQDPMTADDNAVLPLVLKEGWNRSIAVFSSQLTHVKRGALFSFYPDNRELGRTLAASALRLAAAPKSAVPGVLPLRQALAAVNIRTATHLGIEAAAVQSGFDLVYPAN